MTAPKDPLNVQAKRGRVTVPCAHCGGSFTDAYSAVYSKRGKARKYCSVGCATTARNPAPNFRCLQCGTDAVRRKGANNAYDYTQKFCGVPCANAALNKGGHIHHTGYRYLNKSGRTVAEHREVMAKKIGRELHRDETVHHIDGDRLNNDPSNLELWVGRHGRGQRVDDQIIHARQIFDRYAVPVDVFTVSEAVSGLMAC